MILKKNDTIAPTEAVIRHEKRGVLVWSGKTRKFYSIEPLFEEQVSCWLAGTLNEDNPSYAKIAKAFSMVGLATKDRFEHIFPNYEGGLSAPLEAYVDYTWVCNLAKLKCGTDSFCYAAPALGKTTMNKNFISIVLSEFRRLGIMKIHLAGGEPTSNPALLDFYLCTCQELGLGVSFTTNGTMITPKIVEMIAKYDVTSVTFSVDGADEERFSKVRGPNLFGRVIKNIKFMLEQRKNLGFNTKIHMKSVFDTDTSILDIEDLTKLAIVVGVDSLKLNSPEKCTRHNAGHYTDRKISYYKKLKELCELENRYRSKLSISLPNNPLSHGMEITGLPETKGCIGGNEIICINPNGSITPCAINQSNLASFDDWDNFEDFWQNSSTLTSFRSANEPPKLCQSCNWYKSCKSGSTARKIADLGLKEGEFDYQGSRDPLCPATELESNSTTKLRKNPRVHGVLMELNVAHSL